jgi:hypothetical protein
MNLEQKVDAILAAVQNLSTPPAPTVDFTPVLTAIAAVDAKVTDIQGQIDEPVVAPAPSPEPATTPDSAPNTGA